MLTSPRPEFLQIYSDSRFLTQELQGNSHNFRGGKSADRIGSRSFSKLFAINTNSKRVMCIRRGG